MILLSLSIVAREITHTSMHEYVWRIKCDQGEIELSSSRLWIILMSRLPTCWHTCKLPHCAIDPDVAFWYHYLSPAWMHRARDGVLSLDDAQQETSLGLGLLKKIVVGKKEFIGRSYENCHFQCKNSVVLLLLRRQWHSNSTWNWFHVFSYERLFSFCYW